ncbi:hypothetical protein, partial [Streptomyces sp. NPDC002545]
GGGLQVTMAASGLAMGGLDEPHAARNSQSWSGLAAVRAASARILVRPGGGTRSERPHPGPAWRLFGQ